jgi:hypothetical protein
VPNRDAFACNLNYDRVCVNSGASIITLQLSLRGKEIARSPRNPSTSTSALPSSESEGHRHVSFQQTLWWFHFCNRSIKSPAFAQVREIREVRGFATGFFKDPFISRLTGLRPIQHSLGFCQRAQGARSAKSDNNMCSRTYVIFYYGVVPAIPLLSRLPPPITGTGYWFFDKSMRAMHVLARELFPLTRYHSSSDISFRRFPRKPIRNTSSFVFSCCSLR